MRRRAAILPLLLWLCACGEAGGPDGRLRTIRNAAPAPAGGAYVVAERIGGAILPRTILTLTVAGNALYAFMTEGGIQVFDISDPGAPVLAARIPDDIVPPYPRNPHFLSGTLDGDRLLVCDTAGERVFVFDVTDRLAPKFLEQIAVGSGPPVRVVVRGADWILPLGRRGLALLPRGGGGAEHPAAQRLLTDFDLVRDAVPYPPSQGAAARWILAGDTLGGGLRIIDMQGPAGPANIATLQCGSFCDSVVAFDGFAVVSNRSRGSRTIDLTDPARPFIRSTASFWWGDFFADLVRWEARRVLAAHRSGIVDVLDYADPGQPVWLGRIPLGRPATALAVAGDVMFVGVQVSAPQGETLDRLQVWRLIEKGGLNPAPRDAAGSLRAAAESAG